MCSIRGKLLLLRSIAHNLNLKMQKALILQLPCCVGVSGGTIEVKSNNLIMQWPTAVNLNLLLRNEQGGKES